MNILAFALSDPILAPAVPHAWSTGYFEHLGLRTVLTPYRPHAYAIAVGGETPGLRCVHAVWWYAPLACAFLWLPTYPFPILFSRLPLFTLR
jgi:hypothetical protein